MFFGGVFCQKKYLMILILLARLNFYQSKVSFYPCASRQTSLPDYSFSGHAKQHQISLPYTHWKKSWVVHFPKFWTHIKKQLKQSKPENTGERSNSMQYSLLENCYPVLYVQSIPVKEFLSKEICVLWKEVCRDKDKVIYFISSF